MATGIQEPAWPAMPPLAAWQDTYATLHRWVQIVGKLRLELTPLVNHWWNTALHVGARGLTTLAMPCSGRWVEASFDFLSHDLLLATSEGLQRHVPLYPRSVAEFYGEVMGALDALCLPVAINPAPQEIPEAIPFDQDDQHRSYDVAAVRRWWLATLQAASVLEEFRSRFRGKCSPVHFFWGSFDLAVSRFSGRRAPPRPGADYVTREAYSDEVSSAGFWPGGGSVDSAAFYSYFAPEPRGYSSAIARPRSAWYHRQLREFVLPYEDLRREESPRASLLHFLQSTYEAGADLAGWDREALERHGDEAGRPTPAPGEEATSPPSTGGPEAAGP
ncbi:MAG TPA: DUF5996 family protein [Myxococcales bacterium]|jgi:hypothetical protein